MVREDSGFKDEDVEIVFSFFECVNESNPHIAHADGFLTCECIVVLITLVVLNYSAVARSVCIADTSAIVLDAIAYFVRHNIKHVPKVSSKRRS